jgi:pyruvate carboxylase
MGAYILGVKDIAGVLKPRAATILIGALKESYPDVPIHVHTHDSTSTGIASTVACAQAGANIIDCATNSLSGITSHPSISAVVSSLKGGKFNLGLNHYTFRLINSYWALVYLLHF